MENNQSPVEYKLLIDFVYEKKSRFFKKAKHLIQNKPFRYGLKIKNINTVSIPGGKIKKLLFKSTEGSTIIHNVIEELSFPELNPRQEVTLWWPDFLSTVIKGQVWIQCTVDSGSVGVIYKTFQFEDSSKKEVPYSLANTWGNVFLIRGELEQQQSITNNLILLLTLLVFLDGVWGLDLIFNEIFKIIGLIFLKLGTLFGLMGVWFVKVCVF